MVWFKVIHIFKKKIFLNLEIIDDFVFFYAGQQHTKMGNKIKKYEGHNLIDLAYSSM